MSRGPRPEMRRGETCFRSIARLRRLRLANDLAALVLVLAGLAALGVFVVSALFWSGWVLVVIALPFAYLAWRWLSGLSRKGLARRMEEHFPEVRGRLVSALELSEYQEQSREGYSLELIDAAVKDAEARVAGLALGRVVERRRLVWAGIAALVGAGAFLGYHAALPVHAELGLLNAFAPGRVPIEFAVTPQDTAILPGGELVLRCRVEPAGVFRKVLFEVRSSKFPERRRVALAGNVGQVALRPKSDFRYRFKVLSHSSAEYEVRVIEPLGIERLAFTYHYPEYSRLPERRSSGIEIACLKGTRVEFEGEANRALAAGRLVTGDDTVAFEAGPDASFRGQFVVRGDREARLELADTRGAGFQSVEMLRIRAMPDEPPLVKVFFPGRDVDLPMSMQVVLGVNSLDDFGLGALYLHYSKDTILAGLGTRSELPERNSVMSPSGARIKGLSGRREDTTFYTWDLSELGLLPGEAMSYYLAASDNDAVSGPNFGRTEVFKVRFPTMTEIYSASVRQTERTAEELAPIRESQEKLDEELARISRQLQKEGNLSWDERAALQQVVADQAELTRQIDDLRKEVADLMDELSAGMQLDQETMERMGQLQELLSKLLPEELKQSLARLSQELEQQSPDLRKALSEFKLDQEQLRQSIEQALEFLNRVIEEQRLEALARKAEDLAKTQEDLVARLGSEDREHLARLEEELGRGIDSLNKELENLAGTMSDSAIADSLGGLAEQMGQDSLSAQAGRTAQSMRQAQNQQAKAQGQKLGQKLESLSQSLSSMSQSLKRKRSNEVARQLMLAAEELLAISQRQEKLASLVGQEDDAAGRAGVQMGLSDGTGIVAESLASLGSRTMGLSSQLVSELGRAMSGMKDAAQSLVENRAGPAQQQMTTARAGLDRVVGWILVAMAQAQQGGGMSGGMEGLLSQLSQMTADQMAINAGMGGIPIPVPGGLTAAQMQALQRMMSMQQALRERLEQLLGQMGGQQPGLTSSLEGVVDEMRRVERDLAELNVSRELLERQESVLSHLLDAQRSVRQRGFKEERESEAAKQYEIGPSPRLPEDAGERNRRLREELMRALKDAQFSEYEPMIRAYFEQLLNQP